MVDRDNFISSNIGLVHSCARRYKGRGIEYDDLFQAGCLGLVKAADNFDETRNIKFSTYAVPVILGEIRRLFREGGTVKVGRMLKELSLKATKYTSEFLTQNGREPTISELAQALGVEREQAAQAINASMPAVSLTEYDDSGDSQIDIKVENFDSGILDLLALRQIIHELDGRDRELISLRYFKGCTQVQTAGKLGMTQVQVSRREKVILNQMRHKMIS